MDAFHRAGIGVLLDVVLVHFPDDATGLAHYDNDNNLFESPIPERQRTPWGTSYFDFARNEVKSFLISSLFHWVEEHYIDGVFRASAAAETCCDTRAITWSCCSKERSGNSGSISMSWEAASVCGR